MNNRKIIQLINNSNMILIKIKILNKKIKISKKLKISKNQINNQFNLLI